MRSPLPWGRGSLLAAMFLHQQTGQHRANQRGMDEFVHRRPRLGADFLKVIARLVQLEFRFDLPADAIEIGYLVRPESWGQVGQVEAIGAVRCRDLGARSMGGPGARDRARSSLGGRCVDASPGSAGGGLAARGAR